MMVVTCSTAVSILRYLRKLICLNCGYIFLMNLINWWPWFTMREILWTGSKSITMYLCRLKLLCLMKESKAFIIQRLLDNDCWFVHIDNWIIFSWYAIYIYWFIWKNIFFNIRWYYHLTELMPSLQKILLLKFSYRFYTSGLSKLQHSTASYVFCMKDHRDCENQSHLLELIMHVQHDMFIIAVAVQKWYHWQGRL